MPRREQQCRERRAISYTALPVVVFLALVHIGCSLNSDMRYLSYAEISELLTRFFQWTAGI
jgi:hypothetical protein